MYMIEPQYFFLYVTEYNVISDVYNFVYVRLILLWELVIYSKSRSIQSGL